MNKITFGERLKFIRTQANIKQKDIAELLGVTVRAIVNYENNSREPNIAGLIALADYFNVSLDYLVGRSDESKIRKD